MGIVASIFQTYEMCNTFKQPSSFKISNVIGGGLFMLNKLRWDVIVEVRCDSSWWDVIVRFVDIGRLVNYYD